MGESVLSVATNSFSDVLVSAEMRARATAIFMVVQPVTIAFGSTLSGFILDIHGWLGQSPWSVRRASWRLRSVRP